jgi:hypothetical protein
MFGQTLKLIPRIEFERIVRESGAEYRTKGLSSRSQSMGMQLCEGGRARSLRNIKGGLKGCNGRLACLRDRGASALRQGPRRTKVPIQEQANEYRSTVIDLCLPRYDWTRLCRTKGAVKPRLVLDHDVYLSCFGIVTEGTVHDVKAAH